MLFDFILSFLELEKKEKKRKKRNRRISVGVRGGTWDPNPPPTVFLCNLIGVDFSLLFSYFDLPRFSLSLSSLIYSFWVRLIFSFNTFLLINYLFIYGKRTSIHTSS